MGLGIVAVAALIACSLVLMSEKSLSSSWGASGDKNRACGAGIARADALRERCGLTVREGEVLAFILEDRPIASIANEMVVSESTVNSHLHNSYTKFGVRSRGELQNSGLFGEIRLCNRVAVRLHPLEGESHRASEAFFEVLFGCSSKRSQRG